MIKKLAALILLTGCLALFATDLYASENQISEKKFSAQVIKIYDESALDELEAMGARILRRRGDLLLCFIPTDNPTDVVIPNGGGEHYSGDGLSTRREVKAGQCDEMEGEATSGLAGVEYRRNPGKGTSLLNKGFAGEFSVPTLDKAVEFYDAFGVQAGYVTDTPFTGKGIVVGICDIGIDPLHPTFLDADGSSRIKKITQYVEGEGKRMELAGDEAYKEWVTDNADNYHATHVCGILAGNGAGTPYRGIAPDADIVVSTSTLTDVGLLAGVEDIIDYAKEVGKPCVINLSMGNYLGAHDGTSLFSQYLDLCAEDAIIVLSSGNEGNRNINLHHTFSDSKPFAAFRLGNARWNQVSMYGMTDIWGGDDTPLAIQICIYDDETYEVIHSYDPVVLEDFDSVTYKWNPENPESPGGVINGFLTVFGGVDPENDRYEAALVYKFESPELTPGRWAKYIVAVKIFGDNGNDVEVYADGTYSRLMSMGGFTPDSGMSISDLACGHRVISVGMYGNRATVPATESNVVVEEATGYEPGQTVIYSSYGTLRDGRVMPLTVAPGAPLMSAGSRPYLLKNPGHSHLQLDAPWISEPGTSMSAPYVAGYIATWLEALPDLSPEDVQGLIAATNRIDIPDPADPHNGLGWFDPLTALRKAIEDSGVEMVHPESLLCPEDPVTAYSAAGLKVYEGEARGMDALSSGIYILRTPYGVCKKKITM